MYTSKAIIEKYLLTDIDTSFDTQITNWITAAKEYIDWYTDKDFDETTEDRFFDGNGKRKIVVDDLTAINTLQILDTDGTVAHTLTEGAGADFQLSPYNKTPKFEIILIVNSSVGEFTKGIKNLKINADWRHKSSVPKDIELAATILVAEIVKQGRDGGLPESEDLGDYSTTFETFNPQTTRITEVRTILNRYRILEI